MSEQELNNAQKLAVEKFQLSLRESCSKYLYARIPQKFHEDLADMLENPNVKRGNFIPEKPALRALI